jgi:pyruvate ferredoxin oxidoreductase alpha subunit
MAIATQPGATTTATPKLEGEEELLITGSEAIAHALRLADVDIVAAYPIRPYDAVM